MYRNYLVAFGAGAMLFAGCSAASPGQRPNLSASGWLNLPSGKSSFADEDLAGKALFVEFWATW